MQLSQYFTRRPCRMKLESGPVTRIVFPKLTPIGNEESVYLQVHFRRKEGRRERSRLRCPPLPDPPKVDSSPSPPDHGKSLNPTSAPPSLPPPSYTASASTSPLLSAVLLVGRSPSRSVPLWTSIHPVHAAKLRERERERERGTGESTRVYRVNLDVLPAPKAKPDSKAAEKRPRREKLEMSSCLPSPFNFVQVGII